jgi:hypothetical protein
MTVTRTRGSCAHANVVLSRALPLRRAPASTAALSSPVFLALGAHRKTAWLLAQHTDGDREVQHLL